LFRDHATHSASASAQHPLVSVLETSTTDNDAAEVIQKSHLVVLRSVGGDLQHDDVMRKKCLYFRELCVKYEKPHFVLDGTANLQLLAHQVTHKALTCSKERCATAVALVLVRVHKTTKPLRLAHVQAACRSTTPWIAAGGGWTARLQAAVISFYNKWKKPTVLTSSVSLLHGQQCTLLFSMVSPSDLINLISRHQKPRCLALVLLHDFRDKTRYRQAIEIAMMCQNCQVPFFFLSVHIWMARIRQMLPTDPIVLGDADRALDSFVCLSHTSNCGMDNPAYQAEMATLMEEIAASKRSEDFGMQTQESQASEILSVPADLDSKVTVLETKQSLQADDQRPPILYLPTPPKREIVASQPNQSDTLDENNDDLYDDLFVESNSCETQERSGSPRQTQPRRESPNHNHGFPATSRTEDGKQVEMDKDRLRIGEEIILLEKTIEELNARRTECNVRLELAKEKEVHWKRAIRDENLQSIQLVTQKEKQEALLRRLQQSMAQTKAGFSRLTSPDVTVEEFSQILANQDYELDSGDEVSVSPMPLDHPEEYLSILVMTTSDEVDGEFMGSAIESDVGQVSFGTDLSLGLAESFFPTVDDVAVLTFPDVDQFWNVLRDESLAQCGFLCSVSSEATLKAIVDLSTKEILSIDPSEPSGHHREAAMRNTCIDFSVLGNGESPIPAPCQRSTSRIDPNIPICPFELTGSCADLVCPYQHLEPRALASILPREYLPLPLLSLGEEFRRQVTKTAVTQPKVFASDKDARETREINVEDVASVNFIELPPAENDALADTHGENQDDTSERRLLALGVNGRSFDCWWMPDTPVYDEASIVAISDFLLARGAELSNPCEGTSILRLHFQAKSPSIDDGCRYAGMLIDMTRFALHAGRFDISCALHQLSLRTYTRHWNRSNRLGPDRTFCDIFSSQCLTVIETASSAVLAHDSSLSKNSFRVTFEAQTRLALSSFFFMKLRLSMEGSFSEQDLLDWSALSSQMEGTLSETSDIAVDNVVSVFESACTEYDLVDAPQDTHQRGVHILLKSVRVVVALRPSILRVHSPLSLVDDILYPTFNLFRKMILGSAPGAPTVLKGAILFLNVVLDVLESCSLQLQHGAVMSDFVEVNSVIDKLLGDLRLLLEKAHTMDYLISPVFAANVALAVSARLYRVANNRLVKMLGTLTVEKQGFAPYSEILWSQLVQLRMSLPTRNVTLDMTRTDQVLAPDTESNNAALCKIASALGVFPHRVNLSNDWNFIHILRSSGILNENRDVPENQREGGIPRAFHLSCRLLHDHLTGAVSNGFKFTFSKQKLQLRSGSEQLLSIKSAIPHSLLLGGKSIVELDVSHTDLRLLPTYFGEYFPNLKASARVSSRVTTWMARSTCRRFFVLLETGFVCE
jgi:Putative zinc-finger domain